MRYEIRFHGRGGQGAVTAAEILAYASIIRGYYSQAFPEFGAERRGAPVKAYFRFDDSEPIYERNPIEAPDQVVVLDEGLLTRITPPPYSDVKKGGWVLVNTPVEPEKLEDLVERKDLRIAKVDATSIALEIFKRAIVNTVVIGSLLRIFTKISLEDVEKAIYHKFPENLARLNVEAVRKGYEKMVIVR
ncbi:MAG: 2-oxoacid:acceptor oxidoreductase family protein [Sulfolobales archaeon]